MICGAAVVLAFAEQVSASHLRVSYKSVKKECPTRVSSQSVAE